MKYIFMFFDRIEFCVSEGLQGLRRHPLMAFAAVTTIAMALFLMGGLGYVYYQVNNYAASLPDKFEMRVFLKDGVTMPEIQKVAKHIRSIDGVALAEWIPRDKMWERMKGQYPKEITDGLDNPIPDSFKVKVTNLAAGDKVADTIRSFPEVRDDKDGIQYLKHEQELLEQTLRLIRWLGAAFGGLLAFTGGILIYNAIRLSVVSRTVEMRIMSLVGASRFTIRFPFYIEGALQGLMGGALATFMVMACNRTVGQYLGSIEATLSMPTFPLQQMVLLLGGAGTAYGLVCTVVAQIVPYRH